MSLGDWIALASLGTTWMGGLAAVVRFFIHNATKPIADKVAQHDVAIGQQLQLSNSTNLKVARIEGYMAANNGNVAGDKLPAVTPTVEVPYTTGIRETPQEQLVGEEVDKQNHQDEPNQESHP